MSGVFISYRRGFSTAYARQIYEKLSASFGSERVFYDIDTIEAGADFIEVIESTIDRSGLMVVVIDPTWVSAANPDGSLRLHDEDDPVRLEVSRGLVRDITVLPVLVGGARMPRAEELPANLQALVRRNAHELSDTRWKSDMDALVGKASKATGIEPGAAQAAKGGRGSRRTLTIAGAAAALLAVVVAALFLSGTFGGSDEASGKSTASIQLTADTVSIAQRVGATTGQLSNEIATGGDTGQEADLFEESEADATDLESEVKSELSADDPGASGLAQGASGLVAASADLARVAEDPTASGAEEAARSARENMDSALAGLEAALNELQQMLAGEGDAGSESTVQQSLRQLDQKRSELAGLFDGLIQVVSQ